MSTDEPRYIVHLAGPPIRIGALIRQRCCWCGALIEERDLDNIAVQVEEGEEPIRFIDDEGRPIGGWDGFVAIAQSDTHTALALTAKWKVDDPGTGDLPEYTCADLPGEVTT